jgi:hypothetical protein
MLSAGGSGAFFAAKNISDPNRTDARQKTANKRGTGSPRLRAGCPCLVRTSAPAWGYCELEPACQGSLSAADRHFTSRACSALAASDRVFMMLLSRPSAAEAIADEPQGGATGQDQRRRLGDGGCRYRPIDAVRALEIGGEYERRRRGAKPITRAGRDARRGDPRPASGPSGEGVCQARQDDPVCGAGLECKRGRRSHRHVTENPGGGGRTGETVQDGAGRVAAAVPEKIEPRCGPGSNRSRSVTESSVHAAPAGMRNPAPDENPAL